MTPTPLGPRVDVLEEQVAKLERSDNRLRRDISDTRKQMRELTKFVHETLLPSVQTQLDSQTEAINEHVDERLEQQSQFVLSTLVDVARQWPASAIVVGTLAGTFVLDGLLALLGLPHLS